MATFVLVYRAPRGYTPGNPEVAGHWQRYLEGLGDHLVDAGNPVFSRTTIGNAGGDSDLGGYSLITAPDAAAAVELAEACPILGAGGGVEVGELTLLNLEGVATTAGDHAAAVGPSR